MLSAPGLKPTTSAGTQTGRPQKRDGSHCSLYDSSEAGYGFRIHTCERGAKGEVNDGRRGG